ncbi:CsgG/HfaB family protein [Nioella sp.]|uniref:CsgG/HfaB family protein n=1 Tax=Nioella sp. TaxID=1912091 RepID=UPI003B5184BC
MTRNVDLPEGPPVEEIVTIFDDALHCLRGHIPAGLTFAVGEVVDATGRESYSDGGAGRFISQGAGEMVQSSLFRSGAAVVNRRDPAIAVMETQWGIRDIQRQLPVNFYISGSINSLDFIPGGGASISVAGVGPSYRQSRILVGLDLSMTDALTGRIVASVPLQRQMFSREVGASVGRFFGALLHKSVEGQASPFPGRTHPTGSVTGMPRAV